MSAGTFLQSYLKLFQPNPFTTMVLFRFPLTLYLVFFFGTVFCFDKVSSLFQRSKTINKPPPFFNFKPPAWVPPALSEFPGVVIEASRNFARDRTHELASGVKSVFGGHPVAGHCVDILADTFENNFIGAEENEQDPEDDKTLHKEFADIVSLLFKTAAPNQASTVDLVTGIADWNC